MSVKDSLPEEIMNIFHKADTDKRGKQVARREFIENLFEQKPDGRWVVNYEKPFFQMKKERLSMGVFPRCWSYSVLFIGVG